MENKTSIQIDAPWPHSCVTGQSSQHICSHLSSPFYLLLRIGMNGAYSASGMEHSSYHRSSCACHLYCSLQRPSRFAIRCSITTLEGTTKARRVRALGKLAYRHGCAVRLRLLATSSPPDGRAGLPVLSPPALPDDPPYHWKLKKHATAQRADARLARFPSENDSKCLLALFRAHLSRLLLPSALRQVLFKLLLRLLGATCVSRH